MNRRARRSDMRTFRHVDLLTHMVSAIDVDALDPFLKNAVANFEAGRVPRKLFCPACKVSFADDDARVGAFLFAMPLNVDDLVATSVICAQFGTRCRSLKSKLSARNCHRTWRGNSSRSRKGPPVDAGPPPRICLAVANVPRIAPWGASG